MQLVKAWVSLVMCRFNVQLTACKVKHIETFAKQMLAEGHCVVIGLQSTGWPSTISQKLLSLE